MLDLTASIEPGKSAAGFKIGQRLAEILPSLRNVREVDYVAGFNLNAAIQQNEGALIVRKFARDQGTTIHLGPDVVRLVFSINERLGCIYVFEGYRGAYKGVRTGDPLSSLLRIDSFEYDEGDEMYYRVDASGEYLAGFAVVAVETEAPERVPVDGFSVHDWTLFRSER